MQEKLSPKVRLREGINICLCSKVEKSN